VKERVKGRDGTGEKKVRKRHSHENLTWKLLETGWREKIPPP